MVSCKNAQTYHIILIRIEIRKRKQLINKYTSDQEETRLELLEEDHFLSSEGTSEEDEDRTGLDGLLEGNLGASASAHSLLHALDVTELKREK
jgi:hypothetical protein